MNDLGDVGIVGSSLMQSEHHLLCPGRCAKYLALFIFRHKVAELRQLKGDKTEIVVIFMPDVWNLVLTSEEWAKLRNEQKVSVLFESLTVYTNLFYISSNLDFFLLQRKTRFPCHVSVVL